MVIKTASPGIIVNEVDLTKGTIDAITSNVGAFAGPFEKGPVDEFVLINTEAEFQRVFGNPTEENYEYWWTVNNFLDYGGVCYVVRCDDAQGDGGGGSNPQTMKTATAGDAADYIKNEDDFIENFQGVSDGYFMARNPGTWANALSVAVIDRGADYQIDLSKTGVTEVDGTAPTTDIWDVTADGGVTVANYHRAIAASAVVAPAGTFLGLYRSTTLIGTARVVVKNVDTYQLLVTSLTVANLQVGDTISIDGGTTKVALTTVYPMGEFYLYSSDIVTDNRVNVKWNPATYTLLEGLNVGLPASPTNGQKAIVTLGGDVYVYNSTAETWIIQYALKADDLFTDETHVFKLSASDDWYTNQIAFQGIPWYRFASRPGTTPNAIDKGATNDGLNVILYDRTGVLTGSKGNVLEQYFGVSKFPGAKTQEGEVNYYVDVINNRSAYIFANKDVDADPLGYVGQFNTEFSLDDPGTTIGDGVNAGFIDVKTYNLLGGVDQLEASLGELQHAYNKFNRENVSDLDYILQGPGLSNFDDSVAKANFLISIVEERRDCMCFISPPRYMVVGQSDSETVTDNIVAFAQELSSSSYAVFDSGYKYTYDRFNDKYRYVPLNGDIAGLMVFSSIVAEPWYSPAGMSRGQIRNVVKLPYNPSKTQRDQLYVDRVNPVVSFPGEGTVLFGDKTALGYTSAFDRINVRKLFLVLERAIAKSARTNLFEFNDEITRSLFKNNVNPFLRNVQAKRGMYDFLVVCDASNNPPEVIDRNEFVADIYIKPSRSINYIGLNFIATKTGVTFDESVGLFRGTNQTTNR
jgi:hypothetical protein